jgi:hypothetical protein
MASASSGNGTRNQSSSWWGTGFAYALSLACLLWVYHDFDWKNELPRLARIHWAWILLAVAADVLVYVSQAWRWNKLLTPLGKFPLGKSVQAIYIGLFANEVLPLRSGELIRCYLIAVWNRLSFPIVVSSAVIERLIDGVWLIAGFILAAMIVPMPGELQTAAWILALVVGGIGAVVMFAVMNKKFAQHAVTRHRWSSVLRYLVEGLHLMGRSGSFPAAVLMSTVYLALQVVPLQAMLMGYGLDVHWGAGALVLVVLRLGTVVPGPPGNVGVFHFFCYLALNKVLGVEAQTAKMVSGMMFFAVTVPLLAAGAVALAFTGSEIKEIYRRARDHSATHDAERRTEPAPTLPGRMK